MSYISQLPNFEQYDVDIKTLYYLAKDRIDMLRSLKVDQEQIRQIIFAVFENNNVAEKARECGIVDSQRYNPLAYWLCRMALSSKEDVRWLIDRELICYLLSGQGTVGQQEAVVELTNQNVGRYFPEHHLHLLKMFNEHLRQLNPGVKICLLDEQGKSRLAVTLQALQYSYLKSEIFVLNGYYITTQANLRIAHIVSDFYETFHRYTAPCERALTDYQVDADFRDLLQSIRAMKMSETTIFSDKQALQNGISRRTFATFLQRGAMPLCAMRLYRKLVSEGKLKHQERLQFYSYLRMVGMQVEDAVELIKTNFCRNGIMTEDTFNKQYLYNIEHVYGLKGNRKGALCKSCESYIQERPGAGFAFGCPFSTMGSGDIEELITFSVKTDGFSLVHTMPELMRRKDAGHEHAACQQLFKALFSVGPGTSNPAHYTTEAIRLIKKHESQADQPI